MPTQRDHGNGTREHRVRDVSDAGHSAPFQPIDILEGSLALMKYEICLERSIK